MVRQTRGFALPIVRSVARGIVLVASLAALAAGCSSSQDRRDIRATYDPSTGRLKRLVYDADKNGTPDTVAYMDGTRVLRIEIDKNEDGKVDRWEYYDADRKLVKVGRSREDNGQPDEWAYQAPDGSIARLEISTHRDGKVDRWEYYTGGQLVRVEMDSDGDGRVDQWESYDQGHVVSIAFDTQHRGTPDRRLVYGTNGNVAEVEIDPDGNGHWTLTKAAK